MSTSDRPGVDAATVAAQTWHYGLVARWWSLFRQSGPEIEYFRRFVEAGQPALDLGCGSGRLLVPYLAAGLDVDGCDISPDMLELCREAADRAGHSPNLYAQAMHELDLPRRYRTVFVCGGLGLASSREQDQQALRRMHDHLEPGGCLVLDNEVPYSDPTPWRYWLSDERAGLPQPMRPPGERRLAPDGYEYELRSRLLDVEPLTQRVTWEMSAHQWLDDVQVSQESHLLTTNLYFRNELVMMLERAGFAKVDVRGAYNDAEPTGTDEFLVYVATKE